MFVQNKIPRALPPQLDHLIGCQLLEAITDGQKSHKHVNNKGQPASQRRQVADSQPLGLDYIANKEVHMLQDKAQVQKFKDECRQIIVQEHCAFKEEVRNVVKQVADDEKLAGTEELLPLPVGQVEAQAAATQQIKDEQRRVDHQRDGSTVPDCNVAQEVNLSVGVFVNPVSDAFAHDWPLQWTGTVHMRLQLCWMPQDFVLQLNELVPERQCRRFSWYHLRFDQLTFSLLLVFSWKIQEIQNKLA